MSLDHNTLGFGRPWGAPRCSISGSRCRSPGFDWLFAIRCSLHVAIMIIGVIQNLGSCRRSAT